MNISKKKLVLILLPFILLTITSVANAGIFFYSTPKSEIVRFPTTLDLGNATQPDVVITNGHLFYPKGYTPTQTYPVVIIVHGFEVDSTTDLRMPIELTKRDFFVLAIDLSGAGHTDSTLKPFFWMGPVSAIDYVYTRPDLFDFQHVGMLGHSMGGWSTFLTASWERGHQDRLNCSITWAGIANVTDFRDQPGVISGFTYELMNLKMDLSIFENDTLVAMHNPVEYFNGTYKSLGGSPRNQLILHGTKDDVVLPNQALMANDTCDNSSVYYVNDGHLLITEEDVITKSIQWLSFYLLEQDLSFADILAVGYTYLPFYLLFVMQMLLVFLCTFNLIYIVIPKGPKKNLLSEKKESSERNEILKRFGIIAGATAGIILVMWVINHIIFNLMLTMLIGFAILAVIILVYGYVKQKASVSKQELKVLITSHVKDKSLLKAFHVSIFGIMGYFLVAFTFKALLYYPLSVENYLMAFLFSFLICFCLEIFLRKGIQDHLPIKNRWKMRFAMTLISLTFFVIFWVTIGFIFLSALATFLSLALTSSISIYLYQKTNNILTTTLFQAIIVAFTMGNVYFFFII